MNIQKLIESVEQGKNAAQVLSRVLHEEAYYHGRGSINGKHVRYQIWTGHLQVIDLQHAGKRGKKVDAFSISYNDFDKLDPKVQSNINKFIVGLETITFEQAEKWAETIKNDANLRDKQKDHKYWSSLDVAKRQISAYDVEPKESGMRDTINGRDGLIVEIEPSSITYKKKGDDDHWFLSPSRASTTTRRKMLQWIIKNKKEIETMSYLQFHDKINELFKHAFDRYDMWR